MQKTFAIWKLFQFFFEKKNFCKFLSSIFAKNICKSWWRDFANFLNFPQMRQCTVSRQPAHFFFFCKRAAANRSFIPSFLPASTSATAFFLQKWMKMTAACLQRGESRLAACYSTLPHLREIQKICKISSSTFANIFFAKIDDKNLQKNLQLSMDKIKRFQIANFFCILVSAH